MPTLTFDERKMARIQAKLGPAFVLPPLAKLIGYATKIASDEAITRAPSVLASQIVTEPPKPLMGRVVVRHPGARAMEAGRKPLAAGGNMPPPDAFLRIAGGNLKAAFAIARSVATRGTKGRFFMKKAKAKTQRELPALAEQVARAMADDWRSDS